MGPSHQRWRLVASVFAIIAVCATAMPTSTLRRSFAVSSPVVIVPGDGSNQLEARWNKPSTTHFYCDKVEKDWFRLWLTSTELLPNVVDCWADNIRLVVDSDGRATNAPGVETRVVHFGSTVSMEELDPSIPAHATAAFYQMVQALVAKGYSRNVTVRGAPYDFRYTPDSKPAYGEALKTLIEETVAASGVPATLISHSMGGLQTHYFLSQMPADWLEKNIRRWVPISCPWIGAAKEWRLMATGDNEGLPVSPASLRAEQRSYETNAWLFPAAAELWKGHVFVTTQKHNYTLNESERFFADVGYPVGEVVRRRVAALTDTTAAPAGVNITCVYSTGVSTPLSFDYGSDGFSSWPKVTNGDGDGTVNEQSLRVCEDWKSANPSRVTTMKFDNIDHSHMIMDAGVISYVLGLL